MSDSFDIAVVGGGAAGIAAAVSAARVGCTTVVLDCRAAAGGTGGFSGLTTICGLFDEQGEFLNNGFCREFAEALRHEDGGHEPIKLGRMFVQVYRPDSFQRVASRLLGGESLIATRWNARLAGITVQEGRIRILNGLRVGAIIDCTGTGEVGRAVGDKLLATDETTQAPAVIFALENIDRDLSSPVAVAQVLLAAAQAGLPPLCFMPSSEANAVAVKFTGRPDEVPSLLDFLQRQVAGFARCRSRQQTFALAQRAGAMIVGRYLLTGVDVLGARKFADAAARGCWPVEQWSSDGKPRIRYLPPRDYYQIPARSLQSAQTENLFMAGKSLSADVDAIASARVMGCCLATGEAAGKLAASWVRSNRYQ